MGLTRLDELRSFRWRAVRLRNLVTLAPGAQSEQYNQAHLIGSCRIRSSHFKCYGDPVPELHVDIWSDIACPWCYVGKRRLEAALSRFAQPVQIRWHAFELDPDAPRIRDDGKTYAERLAAKYRTTPARAEEMIQRVVDVAAAEGIEMRFDRARGGNTFDAHRVVRLGLERGCQGAVKERLLRAYFTEGVAIGDPEQLARLGGEAGLPEADVRDMLAGDQLTQDVRQDEALARDLGISGVPFFVLAERIGVSGAQPVEVLLGALEQATSASPAPPDAAEKHA
jgi:predicted DsbA family dithiol-disulfide isomerase